MLANLAPMAHRAPSSLQPEAEPHQPAAAGSRASSRFAAAAVRSERQHAGKPHILFVLADDLGWAEVGYHQEANASEHAPTSTLNGLASEGVRLERHYMHKFCAPSRAAIQSGRSPLHVYALNALHDRYNPDDPIGGFAGIPRNMTGLGSVMAAGGYATHFVGNLTG